MDKMRFPSVTATAVQGQCFKVSYQFLIHYIYIYLRWILQI